MARSRDMYECVSNVATSTPGATPTSKMVAHVEPNIDCVTQIINGGENSFRLQTKHRRHPRFMCGGKQLFTAESSRMRHDTTSLKARKVRGAFHMKMRICSWYTHTPILPNIKQLQSLVTKNEVKHRHADCTIDREAYASLRCRHSLCHLSVR